MRRSLLLGLSVLSLSIAGAAIAPYAVAQPPQQQDLNRLHEALNLSPAQQGAWQVYVAAIRPDPATDARRREAARMMPTLNTPRRVDLINAEMDAEMAAMHRQGQAAKIFYAQLSPEQQRVFDQLTYQSQGQFQGQSQEQDGQPR